MKSIYSFFAAVAVTAIVATSCSKYEEGPSFSLRTKKGRISNEWVVESATYNEKDYKAEYDSLEGANYVLEIERDGVYRTEGAEPDKGTWELGEDGDDVRFLSNAEGSKEESFRITRLKSKELWMKQTQSNGDVLYFKFKSKD